MIEIKRKPQPTGSAGRAEDMRQSAIPPPQKQALQPFLSSVGRDYRKLYRIACNFHERHNSPTTAEKNSAEYSQYWQAVIDDMTATAAAYDGDPFLMAMLQAIFEELEREEKANS